MTEERLYGSRLGAGALIDHWVVEALAGEGGFAAVYRARDPSGRQVAVKLLHERMARIPSAYRRFQLEAEAIARLRHPGIVEIVGSGVLTDGRPFLVMEWIDGRTIAQTLADEGRLAPASLVAILAELCPALDAAHAAGVLHRDLKASNVMLGGAVKLVDFGIAKMVSADGGGLTSTGVRLGTPSTMAPEQILGRDLGPGVDIYALGVLVFHALSGRMPFRGETDAAVEQQHLRERPPRLSEHADVPASVDDVVLRAMAKDPADRHATAGELLDDLRDALASPQRPSRGFAVAEGRAVGLFVATTAGGLPAASAACERHGLAVVGEEAASGTLLVVGALPSGAAGDRAARAEALDAALALARTGASVLVHAAAATVLRVDGAAQVVGGEILDPGWQRPGPGAVTATAAVLDGIAELFELSGAPAERITVVARLAVDEVTALDALL